MKWLSGSLQILKQNQHYLLSNTQKRNTTSKLLVHLKGKTSPVWHTWWYNVSQQWSSVIWNSSEYHIIKYCYIAGIIKAVSCFLFLEVDYLKFICTKQHIFFSEVYKNYIRGLLFTYRAISVLFYVVLYYMQLWNPSALSYFVWCSFNSFYHIFEC